MAYSDLNGIHNPATGTSPPATWGDQVRDNDEYLHLRGPYICTSATRPGSPFEGQVIYETDTDSYLSYSGSAWMLIWGPWTAFTPTVAFGATAWTLSANDSRYQRVGKTVHVTYAFRASSFNGGSGTLTATLPVTVRTTSLAANSLPPLGTGAAYDVSAGNIYGCLVMPNSSTATIWRTTSNPLGLFTHASPFAIDPGGAGVGDEFHATITCEVA